MPRSERSSTTYHRPARVSKTSGLRLEQKAMPASDQKGCSLPREKRGGFTLGEFKEEDARGKVTKKMVKRLLEDLNENIETSGHNFKYVSSILIVPLMMCIFIILLVLAIVSQLPLWFLPVIFAVCVFPVIVALYYACKLSSSSLAEMKNKQALILKKHKDTTFGGIDCQISVAPYGSYCRIDYLWRLKEIRSGECPEADLANPANGAGLADSAPPRKVNLLEQGAEIIEEPPRQLQQQGVDEDFQGENISQDDMMERPPQVVENKQQASHGNLVPETSIKEEVYFKED